MLVEPTVQLDEFLLPTVSSQRQPVGLHGMHAEFAALAGLDPFRPGVSKQPVESSRNWSGLAGSVVVARRLCGQHLLSPFLRAPAAPGHLQVALVSAQRSQPVRAAPVGPIRQLRTPPSRTPPFRSVPNPTSARIRRCSDCPPCRDGPYMVLFPQVGEESLSNTTAEYRRVPARHSPHSSNESIGLPTATFAGPDRGRPHRLGFAEGACRWLRPRLRIGSLWERTRPMLPARRARFRRGTVPQHRFAPCAGRGGATPRPTESISSRVRFVPPANKAIRNGILDQTKESFDASHLSVVLDTAAFATCP